MLRQPFLMFSMDLDNTPQINYGRLGLYDYEAGYIGRWVATSGLGQHQRIGGWSKQGGGVLPATYQCNPIFPNYWVDTNPVDLSHVKGVEGDGYCITPFAVETKEGIKRSDLLIHRDANVPGSMGCVVLPDNEWEDFVKVFHVQTQGHDRIRLYVQYNF